LAAVRFEPLLNSSITELALEALAAAKGLVAGKRLIDAQIASQARLPGRRQIRRDGFPVVACPATHQRGSAPSQLAGDMSGGNCSNPLAYSAGLPKAVAAMYGSLMLETREGRVGIVPAAAMRNSTPPTDVEIQRLLHKNVAH